MHRLTRALKFTNEKSYFSYQAFRTSFNKLKIIFNASMMGDRILYHVTLIIKSRNIT